MDINKKSKEFLKPPTSQKIKTENIFSEHYVRMHGQDYYLRVFKDGLVEFTRFDSAAMKWVFLVFPTS
jgi:hypothetical protein